MNCSLWKQLFTIATAAMAVSCGHGSIAKYRIAAETEYSDTIFVNYEDTASLALQDFIDSVQYVVLETSTECPIGKVDAVYCTDSVIVVVDYHIAGAVYLFGKDGSFRGRVSQPGNGPHEYLNLTYVTLSHDSKMVVIQDRVKHENMFFGLDGKYIKSVKGTLYGGDVEYVSENCLVHDVEGAGGIGKTNDNSSFVLTDSLYDIKYTACDGQFSKSLNLTYRHPVKKQGSRVIGRRIADNSIYQFTENGLEVLHYVKIVPDDFTNYRYTDTESFKKGFRQHQSLEETFLETDNYSYFSVSQDYQQDYLYSHSDRKLYRLKTRFDHLILGFFFRPITCLDNDWMVCVSEPFQIHGLANQFPYLDELDPELYKLKESVSLDDNPVIFMYHISL